MKITEITVNVGRTFNNPCESYSNLRPEVTLKASLEDGEDPITSAKELQHRAEQLVEQHKTQLLTDLDNLHRRTTMTRDIARLEEQKRLQRAYHAALAAAPANPGDEPVAAGAEDKVPLSEWQQMEAELAQLREQVEKWRLHYQNAVDVGRRADARAEAAERKVEELIIDRDHWE